MIIQVLTLASLMNAAGPKAEIKPPDSMKPAVVAYKPATKRPVLILAGIEALVAVLDVEGTQRCIHKGSCREANIFMPSGRPGQYAVKSVFITSTVFTGIGLRRTKGKWARRLWWLPQTVNVGMSFYGMSTSWKYR